MNELSERTGMQTFIRPVVTVVSIFILIWAGFALLRLNTVGSHMQAAHIHQGLAMMPIFKVAVLEYYDRYGRLPESNEAVRLPHKESYAKEAVASAGIGTAGVVTITYNKMSGIDGSQIQLVPSINENNGRITWQCVTRSIPMISRMAPQCRYLKPMP